MADDELDPDDDERSDAAFGVSAEGSASDLDPRVHETLRRVYGVPGVVAAKVWALPDRMFVGVRIAFGHGLDHVLEHVRVATKDLMEPGEEWDFGQLDGD